jgi:hypothetical protein
MTVLAEPVAADTASLVERKQAAKLAKTAAGKTAAKAPAKTAAGSAPRSAGRQAPLPTAPEETTVSDRQGRSRKLVRQVAANAPKAPRGVKVGFGHPKNVVKTAFLLILIFLIFREILDGKSGKPSGKQILAVMLVFAVLGLGVNSPNAGRIAAGFARRAHSSSASSGPT